MTKALINPDIIKWAIKCSGLTISEICKKLEIKEEKLADIELGKEFFAFGKAKKFAKITNIPFGFLFLNEIPPEDDLNIPDLRTIDSLGMDNPSPALKEAVRQNKERVEWYRAYLVEQGVGKNPFVAAFSQSNEMEIVKFLNIKLKTLKVKSADDNFRKLVKSIEALGIMVIQDNDLGHYSRPLNIKEFRGFSIADDIAPLIFVNTADSLNARLFTLIHELTHILKGESGISDNSIHTSNNIERFCNAVAGEFLVPSERFKEIWHSIMDHDIDHSFELIAKSFYVSRDVIARRALELNYIDIKEYENYIHKIREIFIASKKKTNRGPNYYVIKNSKLSSQLSQAVISETMSGNMLYRDAGNLLGIKPSNIETFAKTSDFII